MRLTLRRETEWIREWDTPWGRLIDSKLRWLGVENGRPSAARFIAAWDAGDAAARADLEAAFEFFPHELPEDMAAILAHIARDDAARAARMKAAHFGPDSTLSLDQERFLSALAQHAQDTGAPYTLVGDNPFFTAYANDGGFHLESKASGPFDRPTPADLEALLARTESIAYQRILRIVMEAPWLLEPRPGEQPLPGL